jgi:hypothetical protein
MDLFDQMRTLYHLLAWLPLRLLDTDNWLPPTYSIAGSVFGSPSIEGAAPSEEKASLSPGGEGT